MNIKINKFFNNLFLVLCLAVNVFAQNKVGLNYKNPNINYTNDVQRTVYYNEVSKYLKQTSSLKYSSIGIFTIGTSINYGLLYQSPEYLYNEAVNPVFGIYLGTHYAQQSLHAVTYQRYIKIGKALISNDKFQLDNLNDPERVIKVEKLMKKHPGNIFISGGRLLKAGAYTNLVSPLGGILTGLGYQIRFSNYNFNTNDYAAAACIGAISTYSLGTIFDFVGHAKIVKAGKVLENHTAYNVSKAGRLIKQSAKFHNWIYGISLLSGAAMLGNAIFYYNYPTYYYPTETYYAIAITGLSLMFTFDIVSAAKLRKAGTLFGD